MSVEVTERKVDDKRRVTIPSIVDLEAGSKVVVVASSDSAVIAPDARVAQALADVIHEFEKNKKEKALNEWESLLERARLTNLSSEEIDKAVARTIRKGAGNHNGHQTDGSG